MTTLDDINAGLAKLGETLETIRDNQNALADGIVVHGRIFGVIADMLATVAEGGQLDAEAIAALRQMAETVGGEPATTTH